MLLFLSQQVSTAQNQQDPVCGHLFELRNAQCLCPYFLSSNSTVCVKQCSEINEFQLNTSCVKIQSKNSCQDNACCSDPSYGTGFIFVDNHCECSVSYCPCKTDQCCQETQGTQYHLMNGYCKNCSAEFGFGSEWDGQKCVCNKQECYCTSEACCQVNGMHYINGKCDSCESALGTGFAWSGSSCSCQSGTCTCKTQYCCTQTVSKSVFVNGVCKTCKELFNADNSIAFFDGTPFCLCNSVNQLGNIVFSTETQCTTCENLRDPNSQKCLTCTEGYGIGSAWNAGEKRCVCSGACQCQSQQCCKDSNTDIDIQYQQIVSQCASCDSIFGNGAKVDRYSHQCFCGTGYIGKLEKLQDKCSKCPETKNIAGDKCETCLEAFGPGFTASQGICTCVGQTVCTCVTQRCCNSKNPPLIYNQGTCKTCADVYGLNAYINEQQKCQCGKNNYGILKNEGDTCSPCQGIVNLDSTTCTSCSQAYGPEYVWDADQKFCICPIGKSCSCVSELCCQQNKTHYINGKCTQCIDEVGINYIFSNHLKYNYPNLVEQQCVCPNPTICKCTTDYCCSFEQKVIKDGNCVICSERMVDSIFNSNTKTCECQSEQCCNTLSKGFKDGKCVDCSVAHEGTIFSVNQCVCDASQNYVLVSGFSSCQKCTEVVFASACATCSQKYPHTRFNSQSKQCECDPSIKYAGNIDFCTQCPELVNNNQCSLCADSFENTYFNPSSSSCECVPGYKFKKSQCVKSSSNQTIGLAVGIPAGIIVVGGVSAVVLNKTVQKGSKVEETTGEAVQVAQEDVTQVQETVPVE
ncbi:Hypothetical_protein [Hexamita inflata]|uniref:Hypothetical_protein n=1 Tax=Hexamita inflata TaxID=28002 RepID=A0AA86QK00_9EUKA|nr:Hypothetical protein HINF_LOCUS48559 [Hexamita inflata]